MFVGLEVGLTPHHIGRRRRRLGLQVGTIRRGQRLAGQLQVLLDVGAVRVQGEGDYVLVDPRTWFTFDRCLDPLVDPLHRLAAGNTLVLVQGGQCLEATGVLVGRVGRFGVVDLELLVSLLRVDVLMPQHRAPEDRLVDLFPAGIAVEVQLEHEPRPDRAAIAKDSRLILENPLGQGV
ncbi:hypothetical protein D3C77_495590 [compost metagenome]